MSRTVRWAGRRGLAVVSAVAVCATTAALLPVAWGAEPTHDRVVSANPENWTPNVEDGQVNAMVQIGSRIIAVGNFTRVTPTGGATVTRNRIFAFNATTGALDNTFVPVVNNTINDIADAGDGTVYLGGNFTSVNGAARTQRVARINATSGAVVSTFQSPNPNKNLTDIQLINSRLYIGGAFTTVGGQARTQLAALNPTTGADTGAVALTFGGTWNGGQTTIKHFDISDNGATLVAVGNFRTVNGQSRPQIMMANVGGASATLSGWATTRYSTNCAQAFDTYMRDVDIASTNDYFVVVATGAASGGANSGTLCDAAARWEIGPSTAGQNPSWVDYSGGDTLTQVKITGPTIYIGGHQRWMNNPYGSDSAGPGAVSREGLAALDPRNGMPFTWNPTRDRGVGVWEFLPTNAGLWVGHDTNRTGAEPRKRIAFFPLAGGTVIPAENTGSLPGHVYLLGLPNTSDNVVDRGFSGTSVTSSVTAGNGNQDWSSSRGAFMVNGVLYTGWSDGTLKARTYNGTTFGAAGNVNLSGNNNFASELSNTTGMFYDKVTGRLYYTLSGQSSLYYRYFTPQSQLVGGQRFTATGNAAGVNWSQTSGMFVTGSTLYVGSSQSGNLAAVTWNSGSGTVSGNAATVSGPGVDGQDWRSRGTFIYAG